MRGGAASVRARGHFAVRGSRSHQREVEEGDEGPEGEADDDALRVVVHQLHRDRREPCRTEREPPRSEDCAPRELLRVGELRGAN